MKFGATISDQFLGTYGVSRGCVGIRAPTLFNIELDLELDSNMSENVSCKVLLRELRC